MLDSMSGINLPYVSLGQALTNLIDSISKEEVAIADVLSAEGEIIQKIKNLADNVEDYKVINMSINDIVKNLVRLQMLLQLKLEEAQRFICKVNEADEFEE